MTSRDGEVIIGSKNTLEIMKLIIQAGPFLIDYLKAINKRNKHYATPCIRESCLCGKRSNQKKGFQRHFGSVAFCLTITQYITKPMSRLTYVVYQR